VVLTLPDGDADFAGRWRRIKGSFSTRLLRNGLAIKRHASGELALWQRRYWEHTIRDDADFARHVDYIHYNPVKHGLVTRVRDWPYSSFRHYVRRGILPSDWAGDPSESAAGYGERSSSHEP
jgi:putative transposase